MTNHEDLIWKYVDGVATPAEREELEQKLPEDPGLRARLLERQQLHRRLREQELEEPSLRFVKNVMDRLPDLYRRAVEPLVRPFWIKVFVGSLGAFLLGYLGVVMYAVQSGQVEPGSTSAEMSKQIDRLFTILPAPLLSLVAALSIGYLTLIFLDRVLRKRLLKKAS